MLATLAHLLLWLVAAFAAIWALSSLGVAVLAIAALLGDRRVIVEEPEAVTTTPEGSTIASVTWLRAPAPASPQPRLLV
jgi:hypothetical protein